MLHAATLTDYCTTFVGYGQWRAPVWFVGIEEAGGKTESSVTNHLGAWQKRTRKDLESAPEFYPTTGNNDWHGGNATLQPTWTQLTRMLLIAQGKSDSHSAILDYQRSRLGSMDGETCLLELFPLPSPNFNTWKYAEWSDIAWLRSRQTYEENISNQRVLLLRRRIDACRPLVVVFYGSSQLKYWQQIMGAGTYARPIADKLIAHERDNIAYFVTRHPADPKLGQQRDDYFREIGCFFHDKYRQRFLCRE
jgi:hypothetical protein